MQANFAKLTPRLLSLGAAMLLPLVAAPAFATGPTGTGTLNVSATIASSITVTFSNGSSDTISSGNGTSSATLNFGTISAYGTPSDTTNVTVTPNGSTGFTATTPVQVSVNLANDTTAGCTLTASGTDSTYTWAANGTNIPKSTSSASISGCSTTSPFTVSLSLTVLNSAGAGTASNSITFTAVGN